jgi:Ca-activated chloride channel family protein
MVEADLDEDALKDIADATGGKFYRAADTGTIESAFASIDSNQKIEFQTKSYLLTTELFTWLAAPGLALFGVGAWLSRPK